MKRIYHFLVKEEPVMEMIKAGRIRPYLEIRFADSSEEQVIKIPATRGATISIFQEEGQTFILGKNSDLESVLLEIFKGNERVGGVFLQGEQMKAILGNRDLAPEIIIKRLKKIFF